MGKLFGTDGIRGRANAYPINCEIALKTGRAVGLFVKESGFSSVVIGKDTRISGDMLEAALASGITSCGVDVLLAGVIPTPGIAFLAANVKGVGAGIVISASHNPYYDNGIKIFKHGGVKLSDSQEDQIEKYILEDQNVPEGEVGKIEFLPDPLDQYADFLLSQFEFRDFEKKLKIIFDCSNGAASDVAKLVFNSELFAPIFINDEPDGKNINDNCGSQYTETLKKMVLKEGADLGLAFDGDADRLIAVDEKGIEITGDTVIAICSKFAKANNNLKNNIVVSTIMSNVGLSQALKGLGIDHIKSDVGDRRVLEKMKEFDAVVGGEDSGHMIFLDKHTTGDGMLSALHLIEVMLNTGEFLSELAKVMTVYPQVLQNVEVDDSRPDYMQIKQIAKTIKDVEQRLSDSGRVLIRYSGTQPLLRVMVEGPDAELTKAYCQEICEVITKNI